MLHSNTTNHRLNKNKRDIHIRTMNPNFKTYSTTDPKFSGILSDLIETHSYESHGCNQHYAFFFKADTGLGHCSKVVFG
jgi:hypothetical protein